MKKLNLMEIEWKRELKSNRRWRLNKRKNDAHEQVVSEIPRFENRMNEIRALEKMMESLPATPSRRAATIAAYIKNDKSPTVQTLQKSKLIPSPADVLKDIKNTIDNTKNRLSDEARATMALLTASVSGESIKQSRSRVSVAKRLGVSVKRLARSTSNKSCFEYTKRKTRSDALSDDSKKRIYDFWCLPEISHNKNDVKRVRVGTKQYRSHAVQILEKSQSEVYTEVIASRCSNITAQF